MQALIQYLHPNLKWQYIAQGWSQQQAQALEWISCQNRRGLFLGFATGSFLAFSWKQWHTRIQKYFRTTISLRTVQIVFVSTLVGQYLYTGNRKSANELWSNWTINNTLFRANMQALQTNHVPMNRKFTDQEIKVFQQRKKTTKSNIPLEKRKWIYNENIETKQEFDRKVQLALGKPWEDKEIKKKIQLQNKNKSSIIYKPIDIRKYIDTKGMLTGIKADYHFGWASLD